MQIKPLNFVYARTAWNHCREAGEMKSEVLLTYKQIGEKVTLEILA